MAEEKQVTKEEDKKALAPKPDASVAVKEKAEVAKTPVRNASQGGVGGSEKAVVSKNTVQKSVYGERKFAKKRKKSFERDKPQDEFEQKIVDLARVTRVMAGGKRMRFRACVAIGNKKGKIGIGLAKGADVTLAVSKAVANARKEIIDVSIVNDTIPHEVYQKTGAAKILFKPASRGKGVIAGGAVRIILELAGVSNITSKILGTNNKVSIAKCTIEALSSLKKVEKRPTRNASQNDAGGEPKKQHFGKKSELKVVADKKTAVKKTGEKK